MGRSRTPASDAHTYRMPVPRLSLTRGVDGGPLDGARWPRCDVLELELPALVSALEPDSGAEVRVAVDPAQWPDAPRTVMAPGRVIAVEPAGPGSEARIVTLDCDTVGRLVLLVVPPEESAGTAARLLAAADDDVENPLTAERRMPTPTRTGRPGGPARSGRPGGTAGETG
ncbi:DUF5994 family protein [Streptomyces sp. NPDC026672]|uniref:DUF5994 family protein n=1 Tax=unclassified Streptomyces TaxID=2593676 RepID=UPI0033CCE31C